MSRLIHTLSKKLWRQFVNKYPIHTYVKGEMILLEGEEPTKAHFIEDGIVRVYNITSEGEERTVSFDVKGEMFPIGWIMGTMSETQYFYQALTDCDIREIKRDDLLRYLKLHPHMALNLYSDTASRYTALQKRIYSLEQAKAAHKILYTLSYLVGQFGKNMSSDSTQLQIPLTQQEIANFIGLTRETTSIELKKLERLKVIQLKRQMYKVNTAKLQKLLDEI